MSNDLQSDFVIDQQRRLLELQHQVMMTQQELIRMKASKSESEAKAKSASDSDSDSKPAKAAGSDEDSSEKPSSKAQSKDDDEDSSKKKASKSDSDSDSDSGSDSESGPKKKKHITPKQKMMIAALAILFIGAGSYFIYNQYTYENTDDAYVQANDTQLTPMVDGVVTHVFVVENQRVKAGQILVKINESDFKTAVASAEANLSAVHAQYVNAQDDFRRNSELLKVGSISKQDFDHAQTAFQDYKHKVEAAQAQLDQAKLNLDYTSVRAPADGQVARKSVEVGTYAKSGSSLLGFIPGDVRWVDANFKETQLKDVVPGRPAKVTIDAIGGKTFDAVVESVAPATGATFTLLPPDNATGNFTKVVQRVPVRLVLKNLSDEDVLRLHAGLSAVVDVIKHADLQAVPKEQGVIYSTQQIHQPAPPLFSAPGADAVAGSGDASDTSGVRSATTQAPPVCVPAKKVKPANRYDMPPAGDQNQQQE